MGIEHDYLFHKMTLADFYVKQYYHEKRREERIKTQYEAIRLVGVYLLSPHLKKGARVNNLKDVIPLPWEIEPKVHLTKAQKKRLEAKQRAQLDEIIAKHKRFFAQA